LEEKFISSPKVIKIDRLGVICRERNTEEMKSSEKIYKNEDIKWLIPGKEVYSGEYFFFKGSYNSSSGCNLVIIQSDGGTLFLSIPEQSLVQKEVTKKSSEKKKKSKKKTSAKMKSRSKGSK